MPKKAVTPLTSRRGIAFLSPQEIIVRIGVNKAAKQGMFQAAVILQNEWKGVLNRPGTGKLYEEELRTFGGAVRPIGVARSPHRASLPGQPPAPDTGQSRESIAISGPDADGDFRVGPKGPRARILAILEAGVRDHPGGITIEPRPHSKVALRLARPKMTAAMKLGMKGKVA